MRILWGEQAWEDYCYWQSQDKKTLKRINNLIKDAQRNVYEGIGKPEPLKYNDYWSRRIDDTNRLVYKQARNTIIIVACRRHYE